jgi:hypothetical protein
MAVIAIVIGKSRPGQKLAWRDEAVDRPLGHFVPSDIECEKLREELQLAIGALAKT